jgi:glutathione S-transferase
MFELYHAKTAVCAQKVRLVLEEKEQKWLGHELDLRAGDQVKPEYLKLNPNGVVPTLVHDGSPVIESTLINEYLDDVISHRPLKPTAPRQRAEMRLWTKAVDEGLHYAIASLSFAILQRDSWLSKPREELDAHLARLPDEARRQRQRQAIELGLEAPMVRAAILSYAKAAAKMENTLSQKPWLAGSDYSLADVAMTPYISRLSMLGMEGLWGPHVAKWFDRIRRRPNYQRAILDFFPDAEIKKFNTLGPKAWSRLATYIAA